MIVSSLDVGLSGRDFLPAGHFELSMTFSASPSAPVEEGPNDIYRCMLCINLKTEQHPLQDSSTFAQRGPR